jgi:hypothetical protein
MHQRTRPAHQSISVLLLVLGVVLLLVVTCYFYIVKLLYIEIEIQFRASYIDVLHIYNQNLLMLIADQFIPRQIHAFSATCQLFMF